MVCADVFLCVVQPGVHFAVLSMVHALPPPPSLACTILVVEHRRLGWHTGALACRSVQARVLGKRGVLQSLVEEFGLRRWTCMGSWKCHGSLRGGGSTVHSWFLEFLRPPRQHRSHINMNLGTTGSCGDSPADESMEAVHVSEEPRTWVGTR